jgi:hypothetical protein
MAVEFPPEKIGAGAFSCAFLVSNCLLRLPVETRTECGELLLSQLQYNDFIETHLLTIEKRKRIEKNKKEGRKKFCAAFSTMR